MNYESGVRRIPKQYNNKTTTSPITTTTIVKNKESRGPRPTNKIITGQNSWFQRQIVVKAPTRGFHLITQEIYNQIPEIHAFKVGIAHIFIKHTSASLTLNENADPDVRLDLENAFNKIVPEKWNHQGVFKHGQDNRPCDDSDMPGHVKTSLLGNNLEIPITNGKFNIGQWQGIYMCEHRNVTEYQKYHRNIVITIQGLT